MNTEELISIIGIDFYEDFDYMNSKDFEDLIFSILIRSFPTKRQVKVENRGDGRHGKIDFVIKYKNDFIPIEIDRKMPRKKSIFKVKSFNPNNSFIITRSPFQVIKQ